MRLKALPLVAQGVTFGSATMIFKTIQKKRRSKMPVGAFEKGGAYKVSYWNQQRACWLHIEDWQRLVVKY